MRIKMLSIWASPSGNHQLGEVLDIDDQRGKALVDAHHAEEVDKATPPTRKVVNDCPNEPKVVTPDATVPATPVATLADPKPKPAKVESPKVEPVVAPAAKVETVTPKVEAK